MFKHFRVSGELNKPLCQFTKRSQVKAEKPDTFWALLALVKTGHKRKIIYQKGRRPKMGREIYRLYSRPSFAEGIARLFDFKGILNKYRYSHTEEEADFRSIESDWQFVGEDLRFAIHKFDEENPIIKAVN
ncbi:MAG: hypothetical protein ACYC6A_26980, partial [Armatimonadota bacterium]